MIILTAIGGIVVSLIVFAILFLLVKTAIKSLADHDETNYRIDKVYSEIAILKTKIKLLTPKTPK